MRGTTSTTTVFFTVSAAVVVLIASSGTLHALTAGVCPSFASHREHYVGYDTHSVASADLDGDTDADLATADTGSNQVSVLLNRGDGTYARHIEVVGVRPVAVTSADLDQDGDLDLAVANSDSTSVSVLLNRGDGRFPPHVQYVVGKSPISVTSADLDGDGDADLAVANFGSNTMSVLSNQGDGTFAPHVPYAVGDFPYSVANAFLDADADVDLVVGNILSGTVSVLLNQGDGTFAPQVEYDSGDAYSVASADLDRDGDVDVAVANNGSNQVSLLLNLGNGTFPTRVSYGVGNGPFSVATVDLDRDGDDDLAVANSYYGGHGSSDPGTVSVLVNRGNGTFATHVEYGVGVMPLCVTSADLDQDGYPDLVVADSYYTGGYGYSDPGALSVLLNRCPCPGDASWSNYGSGWPGTNGIPTFSAANEPRLCTTVTLKLDNSLGSSTTGLLLAGVTTTDRPTIYDGHVLVVPMVVSVLRLPGAGVALTGALPCDDALCGQSVYLQALEADVGASRGVSFTPGLQLILGS